MSREFPSRNSASRLHSPGAGVSFSLTHFKPGGYELMVALPSEAPGSVQIGSVVHADDQVHSMLAAEQA